MLGPLNFLSALQKSGGKKKNEDWCFRHRNKVLYSVETKMLFKEYPSTFWCRILKEYNLFLSTTELMFWHCIHHLNLHCSSNNRASFFYGTHDSLFTITSLIADLGLLLVPTKWNILFTIKFFFCFVFFNESVCPQQKHIPYSVKPHKEFMKQSD